MTSNVLEGQVVSANLTERSYAKGSTFLSAKPDEEFAYMFLLRASALEGVKVRLFHVTHEVANVYPVTFRSAIKHGRYFQPEPGENEHDFRALLHSEEVVRILQSLIAQSIGPEETLTTAPF